MFQFKSNIVFKTFLFEIFSLTTALSLNQQLLEEKLRE